MFDNHLITTLRWRPGTPDVDTAPTEARVLLAVLDIPGGPVFRQAYRDNCGGDWCPCQGVEPAPCTGLARWEGLGDIHEPGSRSIWRALAWTRQGRLRVAGGVGGEPVDESGRLALATSDLLGAGLLSPAVHYHARLWPLDWAMEDEAEADPGPARPGPARPGPYPFDLEQDEEGRWRTAPRLDREPLE